MGAYNTIEDYVADKTSNTRASETMPRIAILSLRDVYDHVSCSGGYTFEDVIAKDLDDVSMLVPQQKPEANSAILRRAIKARNWMSSHAPIGRNRAPELMPVPLEHNVDLFFYYAARPSDLNTLHAVKGWRRRSGFAVCWLQEIWVEALPKLGRLLDALNEFDHIICSVYHTVQPLRDLLKVPVSYMPGGVDTELFCPFPTPPARAIEIANIGGINAQTHTALIEYTERTGGFYFYSTIRGHHGMDSHVAHRRNYAGTLKRSKYFLSYMAKVAQTNQRGSQEEFGPRYVEGVAAGAVLLGDRLTGPAFEENLGWTDSVIDVPYNSCGLIEAINTLEADPKRVATIRRRNIIQALSRHDHLHRWERVLAIAGMKPSAKMPARKARLAKLIHQVEKAADGSFQP